MMHGTYNVKYILCSINTHITHILQYGACALYAVQLRLQINTTQYVTHIAYPLQKWLNELASILRYTYSDCHFTY